jgi:hypothetical protein
MPINQIPSLRTWVDGQAFSARDYVYERNLVITAVNTAIVTLNNITESHLLDNRYYTETELNDGQLDNRYYTETELNDGQLDNRYFTKQQIIEAGDASSARLDEVEGITGVDTANEWQNSWLDQDVSQNGNPTFGNVEVTDLDTTTFSLNGLELTYDATTETLSAAFDNVTAQLSEEVYKRAYSNETVGNGKVAMFAGYSGNKLLVKLADVTAEDFAPEKVIGVATETIDSLNDPAGRVTIIGVVSNPPGYQITWKGAVLVLDPATPGALITEADFDSNYGALNKQKVVIGFGLDNGIQVYLDHHVPLADLSDVILTNSVLGDVLVKTDTVNSIFTNVSIFDTSGGSITTIKKNKLPGDVVYNTDIFEAGQIKANLIPGLFNDVVYGTYSAGADSFTASDGAGVNVTGKTYIDTVTKIPYIYTGSGYVATIGDAAQTGVNASGFDGNLATTDDTVQQVIQKFDDYNPEWNNVQNKPSTFPPSAHTHDDRYYTETELNNGQLNNLYFTETELAQGALDGRYYTETELNDGQLDTRYYTEDEADALLSGKVDVGVLASNITLYPTNTASNISGYSRMVSSTTDDDYNTSSVDIPTGAITTQDQLIASLAADPGLFIGNPGTINVTTVGNIKKTSGNENNYADFYFEVYLRSSGGLETKIGTSSPTPSVNGALNVYEQFNAVALINNGEFGETDRIVIKYYANAVLGTGAEYSFQFGGDAPVRSLVPVPVSVTQNASLITYDDTVTDFETLTGNVTDNVQVALENLKTYLDTKTTTIQVERFVINTIGTTDFTYTDDTATQHTGTLSGSTFTFDLFEGGYRVGANLLEAYLNNDSIYFIDDAEVSEVGSPGDESTEAQFIGTLQTGDKLIFKYYQGVDIASAISNSATSAFNPTGSYLTASNAQDAILELAEIGAKVTIGTSPSDTVLEGSLWLNTANDGNLQVYNNSQWVNVASFHELDLDQLISINGTSLTAGYLKYNTGSGLWQLVNETYEPADATILKSGDIGVTVQGYDANTLKSGDIGVTVQGYDVNIAKYNAETANFTGNLQVGGSNVVPVSRTIASIDLIDSITATELTAALNTATQSLKGLLSATDKARLDALYALTQEATGQESLVDTINEVLAIFANYPEDLNLLSELNAKALKTNVLELDNITAFTPDADYEPATKKYVDDKTGDFDVVLGSSDTWTADGDFFTLTKSGGNLTGLVSTDNPIADIDFSTVLDVANVVAIQDAWSFIYRIIIGNDQVTFKAVSEPAFLDNTKVVFKVVR